MRVLFIGTVEFSRLALEKLINLGVEITGVVTKSQSHFNADFSDLSLVAQKYGIPWRYSADINTKESVDWIKSCNPDIIFCLGFSQLLSNEILQISPKGVVGFHPAALPRNRGRHPIIWALALGLEKTASTFFMLEEKADTGDIISQREVEINYEDDARSLYDKIAKTAMGQIEEVVRALEKGKCLKISQKGTENNTWRKRTKKDGEISFRMGSRSIYNLVRALRKPYVGAHINYEGEEVKVWRVEEVETELFNLEPGKVLEVRGREVLVKCGDRAVLLKEHEFIKLPCAGEYLA